MSFVEGSFNIIKYQNGTRKVSGVLYSEVSFIRGSTVHTVASIVEPQHTLTSTPRKTQRHTSLIIGYPNLQSINQGVPLWNEQNGLQHDVQNVFLTPCKQYSAFRNDSINDSSRADERGGDSGLKLYC